MCEIFTIETTLDGRLIDKTKPYTKLTKNHFVPFKKQKNKAPFCNIVGIFSIYSLLPSPFCERRRRDCQFLRQ